MQQRVSTTVSLQLRGDQEVIARSRSAIEELRRAADQFRALARATGVVEATLERVAQEVGKLGG